VMRLRPIHAWLLKRLLKHAWEHRKPVYVSVRKMSLEAKVSRTAISTYLKALEEMQYIRRVADCVSRRDRRVPYDVSGAFAALAICIACDPTSKWAEQNDGPMSIEQAVVLAADDGSEPFSLDWEALAVLAKRKDQVLRVLEGTRDLCTVC
jgi:DNA-binding MarR family transcriptional regulator